MPSMLRASPDPLPPPKGLFVMAGGKGRETTLSQNPNLRCIVVRVAGCQCVYPRQGSLGAESCNSRRESNTSDHNPVTTPRESLNWSRRTLSMTSELVNPAWAFTNPVLLMNRCNWSITSCWVSSGRLSPGIRMSACLNPSALRHDTALSHRSFIFDRVFASLQMSAIVGCWYLSGV